MSWLTMFAILVAVSSSFLIADDPCRFEHPSKGIIDLSSLARNDGIAAYTYKTPSMTSNYSTMIRPCFII